jgi:hypothetical protein
MEHVTVPPDRERVNTSATANSFIASNDVATASMPAVIDAATVSATAVRAAVMPVVPMLSAETTAAMNVAASLSGVHAQLQQQVVAPMAAAAALANIHAPMAVEIGRWHKSVMQSWTSPLQSMMSDSFEISRGWLRQEELWRSAFAVPSLGFWDDLNLWPTDGLMTTVFRSLDVARPQLFDMSRTLGDLFDTTRWIGSFGAELWRDLRQVGGRIAYWAVDAARVALARADFDELEDFIDCWLDAAPTQHRVEALVEALVEIDVADYRPEDGHQLLDDLARLVRARTTVRRRANESLLGMRRGRSTITVLGSEDLTVAHQLGRHPTSLLEEGVLNRIQPDVDPRLVELVNNLPRRDRRIAMLRIATGCTWPAAAIQSGVPAAQGEVVRRRLNRHRTALSHTTDPWAELIAATPRGDQRASVGRLRPEAVVIDGATGIWP